MRPQENIFYTIYKENDASPVKVFRQAGWTLENRVSLRAEIIGKSHRIVCRAGNAVFTEFIAYAIEGMTPNPLDHFSLRAGEVYNKTYRVGGLVYDVNLSVRPVLFQTMEHFLESVEERGGLDVLHHAFDTQKPEANPAFTGIAVDTSQNRFHTVHTYPEQGFSICSRSEVCASVAVGTL